MFLPHTNKSLPFSYVSGAHKTKHFIDFIVVPKSVYEQPFMNIVPSVWLSSGRKIQVIRAPEILDHVPIAISMHNIFICCTVTTISSLTEIQLLNIGCMGIKGMSFLNK